MARRLQQQGEIVAFLGMIDAFYAGGVRPPLRRELARHARRLARRFRFLREQVEHATAGGRISFVLDRAEALAERTRHRLELRVYCWHLSNERTPPASLCQLRYANTTALRAYVPGPYHGDIDLFRIADNRPDDPSMGWAGLVDGKIRVHDSPGHHRGILAEPAYRLMAAQVRECMRAVQA
jgi:thioesterase domain-containing protein